jgi:hypothetical protein
LHSFLRLHSFEKLTKNGKIEKKMTWQDGGIAGWKGRKQLHTLCKILSLTQ